MVGFLAIAIGSFACRRCRWPVHEPALPSFLRHITIHTPATSFASVVSIHSWLHRPYAPLSSYRYSLSRCTYLNPSSTLVPYPYLLAVVVIVLYIMSCLFSSWLCLGLCLSFLLFLRSPFSLLWSMLLSDYPPILLRILSESQFTNTARELDTSHRIPWTRSAFSIPPP